MTNPHLTDPNRAEEVARLEAARAALAQLPCVSRAVVEGTGGNCLGVSVALTDGREVTVADGETWEGDEGYCFGISDSDETFAAADVPALVAEVARLAGPVLCIGCWECGRQLTDTEVERGARPYRPAVIVHWSDTGKTERGLVCDECALSEKES